MINAIFKLSMFATLAVNSAAFAQTITNRDPECIGAVRLDIDLNDSVRFYERSAVPRIDCDNSNLPYRVRKAVYQLKNPGTLLFSSTRFPYDKIGFDAFAFVTKTVKHFFINTDKNSPDGIMAGYPAEVMSDGKKVNVMGIRPEAVHLTDLELRGLIIHLAAHNLPDMFSHRNCVRGPWSVVDVRACDVEWWNGAFSVEAEYYIGQAQAPALPAELRAEARAAAIERLTYHLNRLPGFMEVGVMLFPTSGGASFFEGENVIPLLKTLPPGTEVANSEGRFTLLDAKGQILDFDFKQGFTVRPGVPTFTTGSFFNRDVNHDLVEVGDMTCALFKTKITCRHKVRRTENVTREMKGLKRFLWLRVKETRDSSDDPHVVAYGILKDDGSVVKMPSTFEEFGKATEFQAFSGETGPTIPNEVERITFDKWSDFPYDILALDRNGTVYSRKRGEHGFGEGGMVENPELKGQKFRKITGPMLWSKQFRKL